MQKILVVNVQKSPDQLDLKASFYDPTSELQKPRWRQLSTAFEPELAIHLATLKEAPACDSVSELETY